MPSLILLGRKSEAAVALGIAIDVGISVSAVVEDADRASQRMTPLADSASRFDVPITTIDELHQPVDYVISFLYRQRIPKRVLELAQSLPLNFHPAPLPDYRGLGGYNIGILERRTTWAATAHVMEEALDTGDVVGERIFSIPDNATALSLEATTRAELLALFREIASEIAQGHDLPRRPQGRGRYISFSDFERARRIAPTDGDDTIRRKIRAFWFPPYAGAGITIGEREYTVIDDQILRPLAASLRTATGPIVRFGPFEIGPGRPVLVIAEIGVNHNGDRALGIRQIRAAAATGAQAVKFQSFTAAELASADAPLARYQEQTKQSSQLEMLRSLELSQADFEAYREESERLGVVAFSTPFDAANVQRLVAAGVELMKIPSGEITNHALVDAVGRTHLPTIMSTGMSDLEEVRRAIRVHEGSGGGPLALLHCVSSYPAPVEQMNLRAIATLRQEFAVPVGLSDHSIGRDAAIAAVALGADIIEKHFTVDRELHGPDHAMSMEPSEFTLLVSGVAAVRAALGTGAKAAAPSELETRIVARRSLVAAVDIAAGTTITRAMLTAKRPGGGIPPDRLDFVLGKRAARDITRDERLLLGDLATS